LFPHSASYNPEQLIYDDVINSSVVMKICVYENSTVFVQNDKRHN